MTTFAPKQKIARVVRRELCSNVFAHPWGVMLQVFVPGCARPDVHIRLRGRVLCVHAVPGLTPHTAGFPVLNERSHGEGERKFTLAPELDFSRMTQSLHHGVLTLIIPHLEGTAPLFSQN
jgi:HSP20 family molecular chaperone IbpA